MTHHTALGILKELKRNRDSLLWVNHERKEAAFHDGDIATRVDYQSALLARSDPSIVIIDKTDGETLAAS
jgi:hypothetical protein